MPLTDNNEFAQNYIEVWATIDDSKRKALVTKLYAEDAVFYSNEPDGGSIEVCGTEEIEAHVKLVNERLVLGKGLGTKGVGFAVNHDACKSTWEMIAPNGAVVLKGTSILMRNEDNQIERDYIFIG